MPAAQSHIAFRRIEQTEAYLPGTGLAVWEVAWLARYRDGDVGSVAEDLGIECALVQEALNYAADHPTEIELQIHQHVSWTEEEMRRLFPRARAVTVALGDSALPAS